MMLKDACRWASGLILMFGAITTSAIASADHEGNDGNMRRLHSHMRNAHHYVRHNLARTSGYVAALPAADADSFDAPHFVRVGPNGYWVTGNWGCWVDEAQDRIADCDSANR